MKFLVAVFLLLNFRTALADEPSILTPANLLTDQQRAAINEAMDPLSASIKHTVEDIVRKDPRSLVITEGTYDSGCGCLKRKINLSFVSKSDSDDLLKRVQDIKEYLTVYNVGDHATITIDVHSVHKATIQFKKTFN